MGLVGYKATHLCARDDLLHVVLGGGDFFSGAPQPFDAPSAKLLERLAPLVIAIGDGVLATPAIFRQTL